LCLWPLAHEIILFERNAIQELQNYIPIGSLNPEYLKKVNEFLAKSRQLSPIVIVAAMALVPAIVEELFFRCFLFAALCDEGKRPVRAVVVSSALFAAFHLLVSTSIAIERLVPSFVLGALLAWLCWRSGSVVPGMILHALHNGLLILLSYYEPRLSEW